jgi:uncharacterized membrane protein HdeD (DUF308 family)
MKIGKSKIIVGAITIIWGVCLFLYGPFYARGYPIPRTIGVLIVIVGVSYMLFDVFGKNRNE